eukprot:1190292-Prorocentrum_minimum.AAC.1
MKGGRTEDSMGGGTSRGLGCGELARGWDSRGSRPGSGMVPGGNLGLARSGGVGEGWSTTSREGEGQRRAGGAVAGEFDWLRVGGDGQGSPLTDRRNRSSRSSRSSRSI